MNEQPASAYFFNDNDDIPVTQTLSVTVNNEPGVLARVIGLFSGRGYNIESLTVSETEHDRHISRITIVTTGTPRVLAQIRNQILRMIPVHKVSNLNLDGEPLERELALVKVSGSGEERVEALRLAQAFGATTEDATLESFIFQLTGRSRDIDRFIALMGSVGLVEVTRTGVAALSRGKNAS